MTRRLFTAIGLIGVLMVAIPVASASAGSARQLTRIQSPRANQVVAASGRVRVAVHSSMRLKSLRISVNGHSITRMFHRSGGAYRATLRRGHDLRRGVNVLNVQTSDYRDFDHVAFIVARRAPKLLTLSKLAVDGRYTPLRVAVRTGRHATVRAWLNGHRADGAFLPQGRRYIGRLGANDGVRPGTNRLVVLVERTASSGRAASFDVERRKFRIHGVIAGAGADRVVDAGDSIELHGSADGAGGDNLDYHWSIVGGPDGGNDASLRDAGTESPEFRAEKPGTYSVRATVGAASGSTASASAVGDASSTDTTTVTVRTDLPPIGARLLVGYFRDGHIMLDGKEVPGAKKCSVAGNAKCDPSYPTMTYAIFNRQTLQLVRSGTLYYEVDDPAFLANLAEEYNRAPSFLMVVTASISKADDPSWGKLMNTLGVAQNSSARDATNYRAPVTIVGVPGSPAGSAYVSNPICKAGCNGLTMEKARQGGYLRLNPLSAGGDFEFVRNDQTEFNTDENPTPGKITMRVGRQTYSSDVPTDGSSGFFMMTLDSQTLLPLSQNVYVTNDRIGQESFLGTQGVSGALANAVAGDNGRGGVLVMLQSFGTPSGRTIYWQQAQTAIEKLGGNAQVWAQLNLGRDTEPHKGGYALVGRAAMGAPGAESSQSLTGKEIDGREHGLFARGHDNQYLPLLADPTGSINFDLVNIVNRQTAPDGGFPRYTGADAAAEDFLGRKVMKVCFSSSPTCDVRKAYYDRYDGVSWSTILTDLRAAKDDCTTAANKPDAPFTADECDAVRTQLVAEVSARNRVEAYFGPGGLQGPFGAAQVPAIVDIAAISDEIQKDVKPPEGDNAVSHALNIVSFSVKIAGAAGGLVNPAIGTAANGVAAGFGLAAYLTKQDGSPDLIGEQVRSSATQLGSDLTSRYKEASSYFTTEAKIVMSDWTKMQEVAEKASSDDKWSLGDNRTTTAQIGVATRQAAYQALVPAAYPVLYDLGTGVDHANNWICRSPSVLYDKRLFQKSGPDAEVGYMKLVSGGWSDNLMTVGAVKTVGSLHSAYVPAPPKELTDRLFRDPSDPKGGGVGLYKLQFYSPQNFRLFGKVLQQTNYAPPLETTKWGYWSCQSMPNPPGNGG